MKEGCVSVYGWFHYVKRWDYGIVEESFYVAETEFLNSNIC